MLLVSLSLSEEFRHFINQIDDKVDHWNLRNGCILLGSCPPQIHILKAQTLTWWY